MRYDVCAPSKHVQAHILLPKGRRCAALYLNGEETAYQISQVGDSVYVDFETDMAGKLSVEILFEEATV